MGRDTPGARGYVARPTGGRDRGVAPEDIAVQGEGAATVGIESKVIVVSHEDMVRCGVFQLERGPVVNEIVRCEARVACISQNF